ncbi:acetamidase [Clostridia bacterium]|nr:acetamidase [Clostridia bacterium]
MQRALRGITYNVHSRFNQPQIIVKPGETFQAETELCTGNWLNRLEDTWSPDKTNALNPTVVVAVSGAKPGQVLAVDVLAIEPDRLGYTGFNAQSNPLASEIYRDKPWAMNTKTLRIEDGLVHWSDTLKLPIQPMIGTLGVAPPEESLSNARGGRHGGNMDVQEVCPGATVYLPIMVPDALLHIGDVHAIQGDGEICCAGGVECRSLVTLRVRLVDVPAVHECVRIENETHIMTVACERSVRESFLLASEQMLKWMNADYGISIEEGYLLMGQVLEARNTQFVNPTYSYVCKMNKSYLHNVHQ